jgi:osmotically inducible protein OsmC
MPTRTADAEWKGDLQTGQGHMRLGSGAFDGAYDFRSRMGDGAGTNPEELIGAAHAGCFSMALSAGLGAAGYKPDSIRTNARVHFGQVEGGFAITRIELTTEASIPGIETAAFQDQAQTAKKNCPVSKALAGVEITLDAKLV